MMYLFDTNACVEHLRGRGSAMFEARLSGGISSDEVVLCSIVGELIFGAIRSRDSARNLAKIASFTDPFASLPFDDLAVNDYASVRADLTARGSLIGPNDLMIASIALANGLTLVSHNLQEFSGIPGHRIEDWQTP